MVRKTILAKDLQNGDFLASSRRQVREEPTRCVDGRVFLRTTNGDIKLPPDQPVLVERGDELSR